MSRRTLFSGTTPRGNLGPSHLDFRAPALPRTLEAAYYAERAAQGAHRPKKRSGPRPQHETQRERFGTSGAAALQGIIGTGFRPKKESNDE